MYFDNLIAEIEGKKKIVCNVVAPKKLRERVRGINFLSFKLFKSCTLGAKIGRCRKIKFYQINFLSFFFFSPSSFTYIWHLYYHNPNFFFSLFSSILEMVFAQYNFFSPIFSHGEEKLGGSNFDNIIIEITFPSFP